MSLQLSDKVLSLAAQAQADLRPQFDRIDAIAEENTRKVLAAFQKHRVAEGYFAGTTGYGYDDLGRDKLDEIYADIFGTEDALVRVQFVNGTHAITCALFGALKPGNILVSAVGAPYDTLLGVIGVVPKGHGSLMEYGVEYRQVELLNNAPDKDGLAAAVRDPRVKAVLIQRSKGYSTRSSLSVAEIGELCAVVRENNPDAAILVDNCYGEFVETIEPTQAGADLVVGSLIKNPGGGLAPAGGYIAGRRDLVEGAAMRLTAPGIGRECGASLGSNRSFYQGLFLAPHTTAQAVKTAVFAARMMELLGYKTEPASDAVRHDIIQMIHFGSPEPLKRFCKGIQFGAPVDSYVTPEPWDMPGYDCQVIMAAGAFIQGASIELSCDAPMREPYTAYLQGGLTYESGKAGVLLAVEDLLREG
ncbi:MAG: methionine gamma-lyase family protein [Pseudoflavonifractor capillosus]|uniref:methionine gamma-lyase family protein n=1 Tax=Pseudoflavonifractor capillosus TaxID=106588 RepID=UPI0023F8E550|nr:methionine gamma-lyase family protein [Pseudoflavonifractor capillosus]MCI5929274.1 methionine gamma-lyase family protein [Pseudoflavonifractor capillosus]MDY4661305.1 methionine gamma-lyase family protein [Pseudoflavonifractor capillosus]